MKFSSFIMTLSIINLSLLPNKAESQIWTGVEEIKIDHETKLQMFNKTNSACEIAGRSEIIDCLPNTHLNLIYRSKISSWNKLINPWEGSFFIYFVKLDKESYVKDLNGDGFNEIAIYPAVCGNSPKSAAYIYTVKENKLLPYGTGIYYWEIGTPVERIKRNPKFVPDI